MNKDFEYIIRIKRYILLATIIFIFSMVVGATISYKEHEKSKDIAKDISSIIPKKTTKFEQILIILRNNIINSLLGLIGTGIPIMIYDGFIFGMIFKFMGSHGYIYLFGIIPHFMIETSALMISSGIGIRFIYVTYMFLSNKQIKIKDELVRGFSIYVKLIVPMIIIAAFIETFITPSLFKILIN